MHNQTSIPVAYIMPKSVTQHFKEYCEGIARNAGVNCFWITDNSKEVLRKLSKVNRTRRAEHFDSFFYTNIPHDLLLQSIEQLISETYRLRGATYFIVEEDGTA